MAVGTAMAKKRARTKGRIFSINSKFMPILLKEAKIPLRGE
jgi:hypothetical protein